MLILKNNKINSIFLFYTNIAWKCTRTSWYADYAILRKYTKACLHRVYQDPLSSEHLSSDQLYQRKDMFYNAQGVSPLVLLEIDKQNSTSAQVYPHPNIKEHKNASSRSKPLQKEELLPLNG